MSALCSVYTLAVYIVACTLWHVHCGMYTVAMYTYIWHDDCMHGKPATTLRLQLFAGTNFCFFRYCIPNRKIYTSKSLSCEETVMNVFGLAKFITSKVHKTSKPQTNVPVKICHFKVI